MHSILYIYTSINRHGVAHRKGLGVQVGKEMWPSCIPVVGGAGKEPRVEKEFGEDYDNPLGEDEQV